MAKLKTIRDREEYEMVKSILTQTYCLELEVKNTSVKKRLREKATLFILIDGILYYREPDNEHGKVIPDSDIFEMTIEILMLHSECHVCQDKTEDLCNKNFYNIPRHLVRAVVGSCTVCKQAQPLKSRKKWSNIIEDAPFSRLQADCIDLTAFNKTNYGFKWILTVIDVYSKFGFAYPLKTKSAEKVSFYLELLFKCEGPPKRLQTDNGREFKNKTLDDICEKYKVARIYGRPRHPQTQGQVERFNQTLCRYLQKKIFAKECYNPEEKIWFEILSDIVYYYNITIHRAINKTPLNLLKGTNGVNTFCVNLTEEEKAEVDIFLAQECEYLENIFNSSEEEILSEDLDRLEAELHHKKYNEAMSKGMGDAMLSFEVGDTVMVQKDFDNNTSTKKRKFDSHFKGPYKIVEVSEDGKDIFILKDGIKKKISKFILAKLDE